MSDPMAPRLVGKKPRLLQHRVMRKRVATEAWNSPGRSNSPSESTSSPMRAENIDKEMMQWPLRADMSELNYGSAAPQNMSVTDVFFQKRKTSKNQNSSH